MRVAYLLTVLALAACSQPPSHSAPSSDTPLPTYSGYYETDGFESRAFRPRDKPNERWWLVGSLPCAFLDFNQEQNKPWRRVFVEIQGALSPPGKYGHLGFYQRELSVTRMVSCRPLHEGERVGP